MSESEKATPRRRTQISRTQSSDLLALTEGATKSSSSTLRGSDLSKLGESVSNTLRNSSKLSSLSSTSTNNDSGPAPNSKAAKFFGSDSADSSGSSSTSASSSSGTFRDKSKRLSIANLNQGRLHSLGKLLRGADIEDSQVHSVFGLPASEEIVYTESGVVFHLLQNQQKGKMILTSASICFFGESEQVFIPIEEVLEINKKSKSVSLLCVDGTYEFEKVNSTKFTKPITENYPGGWENRFDLFEAVRQLDGPRLEALLRPSNNFVLNLNSFDDDGATPLHKAIKTHDLRIINPFLKYYKLKNLDINIQDQHGWNILHTYFSSAIASESDDDIIFRLIEHPGINPNAVNKDNNTVLHYFCQKTRSSNAQEIAELLLAKGADINKTNTRGESALHYAVINTTVRIIIVKLLLEKGIKINIQNHNGETALHYALHTRRKDLIKILLKASADVSLRSKTTGQTPLEMAKIIGGEIALQFQPAQRVYDFLLQFEMGHLCGRFLAEDFDMDTIAMITPENIDDIFYCLRIPLKKDTKSAVLHALYHLYKERVSNDTPQFEANEQQKKAEESFEEKLKRAKEKTKQNISLPSKDVTNLNQLLGAQWSLNYAHLELLKKVGSGASGKVFKGLIHGKEDEKVAIKILKAKPEQLVKEFRDEFLILSAVQSDFVIRFFGATIEPKVCLVIEYCSNGSLYSVLNDTKQKLDWEFGLNQMFGITAGIYAFHSCKPQIFHRDIKSLNVLVTENFHPKLADFGEARFSDSNALAEMAGTIGWSAPELFGEKPEKYTEKSDIFSLAVLFWEVSFRVSQGSYARPYSEFKDVTKEIQILTMTKEKNLRPTVPKNVNSELKSLIEQGWAQRPNERPTAFEVLERVEKLKKDFQTTPENWKL